MDFDINFDNFGHREENRNYSIYGKYPGSIYVRPIFSERQIEGEGCFLFLYLNISGWFFFWFLCSIRMHIFR